MWGVDWKLSIEGNCLSSQGLLNNRVECQNFLLAVNNHCRFFLLHIIPLTHTNFELKYHVLFWLFCEISRFEAKKLSVALTFDVYIKNGFLKVKRCPKWFQDCLTDIPLCEMTFPCSYLSTWKFLSVMQEMMAVCWSFSISKFHVHQLIRLWYLSHRRSVKAQASLRICVVLPEPSLLHT